MSERMEVSFAGSAVKDLEATLEWYKGQQAPDVGERLVREIVDQVDILRDYPEMGRVVPEFGRDNLRELIHPPFRIVYRRDARRIRVVRVWRSERLLRIDR